MREVAWRVPRKRHDGGSLLWKGEDSLSLASLDSSLKEGAKMPPSLREVAWRVPRKRHDGGSLLSEGEDSLSLALLDSSLREGAKSLLSPPHCHPERAQRVEGSCPRRRASATSPPDNSPDFDASILLFRTSAIQIAYILCYVNHLASGLPQNSRKFLNLSLTYS